MAESLCCSPETATLFVNQYIHQNKIKVFTKVASGKYPKSMRTNWNPNYYTFTFYCVGALIPIKKLFPFIL